MDFTQKQLNIAEIYYFTLTDGSILACTSYDTDLVVDAVTYYAVGIKREVIRYQANLEVDRVGINMAITGMMIGGVEQNMPFLLRSNMFRNARVIIRAVDPTQIGVVAAYTLWDGYVTGDIGYNAGVLSLKCGSILDRLSDKFPKVLYTEFCQHRLYSKARTGANYTLCELTEASWKDTGTFTLAGSTVWQIVSTMFAYTTRAEGYFDQGKFYSGSYSSSIRYHGDGYVLLLSPLPALPTNGATIYASPGCDRTSATCNTKFNNLTHFFGFEFIPKPGML